MSSTWPSLFDMGLDVRTLKLLSCVYTFNLTKRFGYGAIVSQRVLQIRALDYFLTDFQRDSKLVVPDIGCLSGIAVQAQFIEGCIEALLNAEIILVVGSSEGENLTLMSSPTSGGSKESASESPSRPRVSAAIASDISDSSWILDTPCLKVPRGTTLDDSDNSADPDTTHATTDGANDADDESSTLND